MNTSHEGFAANFEAVCNVFPTSALLQKRTAGSRSPFSCERFAVAHRRKDDRNWQPLGFVPPPSDAPSVPTVKRPDDQDLELRYCEYVRLLAQHERQLAGYVHALVPSWQDAEDVLQNTKLRLWEQFDSFQPGTNFAAWSFTIAGYMVRTHRKNQHRERICFSDDLLEKLSQCAPVVAAIEPDARLTALMECVKSLSNAHRKLLRLCCMGQRKIKDIARELGHSPSTTRVTLFRIRQSLSECVERRLREETSE